MKQENLAARGQILAGIIILIVLATIPVGGAPSISSGNGEYSTNGPIDYHLILTAGGKPYGIGNNLRANLGDGTATTRTALVPILSSIQSPIKSLIAGAVTTSLAVTTDGRLLGWGTPIQGRSFSTVYSIPIGANRKNPDRTAIVRPEILEIRSSGVLDVFYGGGYANFFTTAEGLWVIGELLTTDDLWIASATPSLLRSGGNVTWAGAGYKFYAFIQNGTLYGRYGNDYGQLGDGSGVDRSSSVVIATDVVAADVGSYHTIFIDKAGTLWGTGYGIAVGSRDFKQYTPRIIARNVISAQAAAAQTYFLTPDGILWGLGSNLEGQLGDFTKVGRTEPVRIASNVAFYSSTAYVTRSGDLYRISGRLFGPELIQAKVSVLGTPPTITQQPASLTVTAGNAATFTVQAAGEAPLSFQWRKNGIALSGATASSLTVGRATAAEVGDYDVVVSNLSGSATSARAQLTIAASLPRLSNLSVRTTLNADQILIVGMTMTGGTKNVLLRAAGPTLAAFGVPEVMPDPKLDLYNGSSRIASNDNWQGTNALSSAFQAVGAFGYSSPSSLDAALLVPIEGGRTVQVSGAKAGAVLVEGYDAGSGASPRFSNLSARNHVGTGSNILIAGFTLTGAGTRSVLIRAVGPKLAEFGVAGVLQDPKLEIFNGATSIAMNDNWSSSLASAFSTVGAFGLTVGSKDAAIVIPLPAGSYTVQVSGADGGTGEAIVEIYDLP